jgi:cellobiose phosphorylase
MEFDNTSNYIAFNSYGGFNQKQDEYHILNTNTPLPWCNIMANENFGTVVSSYGTVYTYYKNSQSFKLTNWCNDWSSFTPGEKFKGIYEKNYNLVYGFGYTRVLEEESFIKKTMDIFVPQNDNVKIQYINLENTDKKEKIVNIEYKLEPVLGVTQETNQQYILCRQNKNVMEFKNPYSIEFSNCTAFVSVLGGSENVEIIYDPDKYITYIQVKILPNTTENFGIVLGCFEKQEKENEENKTIEHICNKYSTCENIEKEYENTKKYWKNLVVKENKFEDKYLEIMQNGWLLYQTIVCRLFARSGFYQSGGAIGFRDQLQDTLALLNTWPERTRKQIILHSSKQFEKGDVLHWWHMHNNAGIRTYFSDDYLWLPYVLCEYVKKTKDYSILEVKTNYLEDKPMGNSRELYGVFNEIDKDDTVYEHAKKTIKYSLTRQNPKNGLLDIGDGDWNDGFSNIRGQSVWLTFFMINILEKFKEVAIYLGDSEMIQICDKKRHELKHNVITTSWDSDHFVRAFFENGEVLGSYKNEECKIDLISQTWAAIAMNKDNDVQEEIRTAMETADKYLVDKENMIVSLLYPAFNKPKNNPGYIKAYVPGTRENGGQYTHAATWAAKAYFELGENKKAMDILKYINPIHHSDTKEKADIYMVEPYVVAADVYTNPEHVGRGGWTWYTGSSAWMYKITEDYLVENKKDVFDEN